MMVTGSNNEAAALVGVSSRSQRSIQALPHWTDSNTLFFCPVVPLPYVQLKTEKMA